MTRRGFTLWELLVALSLVLLIGAVVVPVGHAWLRSAQFDEARMQLESALASARSEAQRDARPVRIEVHSGADGSFHVVKVPLATASTARSDSGATTPKSEEDFASELGTESARFETVATLPRSVAVCAATKTDGDALSGEPGESAAAAGDEAKTGDAGSVAVPLALATFMPDGEAVGCSACVLTSTQGQSVRITIDGWTGRVRVERVESATTERPVRVP